MKKIVAETEKEFLERGVGRSEAEFGQIVLRTAVKRAAVETKALGNAAVRSRHKMEAVKKMKRSANGKFSGKDGRD